MAAPYCTIEADSPEQACELAAPTLGVAPGDTTAELADEGQYRVTVIRAPATLEVDITHDKMEAHVVHAVPAIGDGAPLSVAGVRMALSAAGVTEGLLPDVIQSLVRAVTEDRLEQRNVTVARGKLPVPGDNAVVTRRYLRPTEEDPGRRQRIVRAGEVLIENDRGAMGVAGYTVLGTTLPAPSGTLQPVPTGDGITADETQSTWTCTVPGFGYLEIDEDRGPTVRPAITISDDKMHAYIALHPPGADEPPLTWEEVEAAVPAAGITHGVLPDRLKAAWHAFEERGDLPAPIRIADGTPSEPGRDAGLEFAVEVTTSVGAVSEEGERIDYRERHAVHNVEAGQLVATWHPAEPGTVGKGVDGSLIRAPTGAEGTLTIGDNLTAAEQQDGTIQVLSDIDGMLEFRADGGILVTDTLTVNSDVDYETGNIDANGSVVIKGTIRAGFRVTSKHDITVEESVEDAVVEAGDALLVRQGIIGGDRGRIMAGKTVVANYAQQAHIECRGDVEIRDSDTNSVIECAGVINATDGHGRLMGGRYTAGKGIRVRVLGSDLGAPTVAAVGHDPQVARELRQLIHEQDDLESQLEQIQKVLDPEKLKQLQESMTRAQALAIRKLAEQRTEVTHALEALQVRREALVESLEEGAAPTVDVLDRAYHGVDVFVRGRQLHVHEILSATRFVLDPKVGEVRAQPV